MTKQEKKDVLTEIHRLTQNDFLNGNDLLYFFCEEYPIPTSEEVEEQRKKNEDAALLTPAEAHFADQMWLIGRAYAASPERYAYTLRNDNDDPRNYEDHHPGKPGESFLGTEGYESFFQDIARILFRPECFEESTGSTTYFRGESKNLDSEIDSLIREKGNAAELIKNLNAKAEAEKVKLSDVSLRHEALADDIKEMKKIVKEAREQLRFFHEDLRDEDGFLAKLKSISGRVSDIVFEQRTIINANFEEDSKLIRDLTACVIGFAKALNAARVLRDATVIVLTLNTWDSPSWGTLKKNKLKQWAAFSKGAKLLVKGAPNVNVSFSSKLLHFYYPKAFFIYDSISASRTPKLSTTFEGFSESAYIKASVMTKAGLKDVLCTYKRNTYEQKDVYLTEKEENGFKNYYHHAARELAFSRFIVKRLRDANCQQYANLLSQLKSIEPRPMESNPFPHCLTITRLVDDLIMNGGTAYQSKDDEQAGSQ